MFQSIFGKFHIIPEQFLKELFKKVIDENVLQKMIAAKKFSINYQDDRGESFLHLCILHSKFKSAKWLIEQGNIDVTLKNQMNKEPLEIAIEKHNHLIVEIILKAKKVNINQVDKDGRSLLQNAVLYGNKEIADELIKHNIDVNIVDKYNRNAMFDAVSCGDEKFINQLLLTNIDLNQVDIDGETILHKKEALQNEDLCIQFIQNGANPTICDKEGKNLLFHAATRGIEGKRLLDVAIEHGCNINAKVRNNNTILMETMLAFYKIPVHEEDRRLSLLQMAENLVVKGMDVNAINNDGESGLFDAIRNHDYHISAFFVQKKVNLNIQNSLHQTPLVLAILGGIKNIDIILLLLKNGANPTIKDNLHKDALEILNELILHTHEFREVKNKLLIPFAQKEKQYFVVLKEILQNSNYNLQNITSVGQPLFFAPLLDGYYNLFQLYITNKFNINAKDLNSLNAFYVYVYTVFNKNVYFETFRGNLIGILGFGAEINIIDDEGKTIFSKIIKQNTNSKLFEVLLEIARFKYDSRDKQGRTVAHHAVLHKNFEILKMIYGKN
ncbi:MAG: ankyrin repeat domain-containing protein, partial [Arcobacter sp.]|nr:ankyrin repeat domain-containing protein [Arcobacter sp.]